MPILRQFRQLDVFTARPLLGNPLAVVLDGEGLSDREMQAFASWTHLSETTFLLPPTLAGADYRLRIFTPGGELPFAGHPTLGSCHAWLRAGGQPVAGHIVQECGVGKVRIRQEADALSFEAPTLVMRTPDAPEIAQAASVLGIERQAILDAQWLDNGPRWLALRLSDAASVLALAPDHAAIRTFAKIGVVGPWPTGTHEAQFEVRAFAAPIGVNEDPVTGSLNAGLAQWLMETKIAPTHYVAAQGTCLGREGRVRLQREGRSLWVGGQVAECIEGTVLL